MIGTLGQMARTQLNNICTQSKKRHENESPRVTSLRRKNRTLREFHRGEDCARGKRVLPFMGYIVMCGPIGYGFSAVLVINGVSIFTS